VAIFGDASDDTQQRRVLQMVKDFGADFSIHVGDFDYNGPWALARSGCKASFPKLAGMYVRVGMGVGVAQK
jgi:hypothetical protein